MDLVHDSPPQISVLSFVSKLTADDWVNVSLKYNINISITRERLSSPFLRLELVVQISVRDMDIEKQRETIIIIFYPNSVNSTKTIINSNSQDFIWLLLN